jgi:ABC-type multidrug transport system permease subunit
MNKRHPLYQLTLVRFREFLREPEAIFWAFVFPLVLAGGLGVAFRNRPAEVLNIVATTPALVRSLAGEKLLHVDALPPREAERTLLAGKAALLVEERPAGAVVFRYDDTNPEGRTARMLADNALQRAAGRRDPVPVSDRLLREAGSRYIDFLIPGLIGMNIMGSAVWSMGFTIVDARRKKLMKRLVATPMPRHYYLLSFVLSRLVLLVVEVAALLGFGVLTFGVPVRGSAIVVAALCVLASLSFGAIGLLIASRVQTMEAASGLMNAVMMPMWVLSGVFFSSARFPDAVQPLIRLLPLTAINDALRANMLQGTGFTGLLPELGVLTFWLAACFIAALKLFRWR